MFEQQLEGSTKNFSETLVSVVIPAYNAEGYILRAIESVLSQTHKNIEIIVVDDGSTDKTSSLVMNRNEAAIRIINQENQGIAEARNTGMNFATGKFICFLDSDDIFYPDKISRQLQVFENTSIVCVGSQMHYLGKTKKWGISGVQAGGKSEQIRSFQLMPFAISSAIFDLSRIGDIGGFKKGAEPIEDLDFMSRVANSGQIFTVMEPLGAYCLREDSISSKKFMKIKNKTRQYELQQIGNYNHRSRMRKLYQLLQDYSGMYFRAAAVAFINDHYLKMFFYLLISFLICPLFFVKYFLFRSSLILAGKSSSAKAKVMTPDPESENK